jgi:hypothetical protein
MSKPYIITFSYTDNIPPQVLHNHVDSLLPNIIQDWWHYLDSSYIVISNFEATKLYNHIYQGIPNKHILIAEINLKNAQGWLPQSAWNWISKYKHLN